MSSRYKGITQPDNVLSIREVARALNVTVPAVRHLVRDKLLVPVRVSHDNSWFDTKDVAVLVSATQGNITAPTAQRKAIEAIALATRTERKLEQLLQMFGVEHGPLELSEENLIRLHLLAREVPNQAAEHMSMDDLMEWARLFFRLNEHTLKLISMYSHDLEPWRVFINAGEHILSHIPRTRRELEPGVSQAYNYLHMGLRSFRQCAYLYCRDNQGRSAACLKMPDVSRDSLNDTILSLSLL